MTTAISVHAVAPSSRADRIGRGLAALAAISTVFALVNGIVMTINAADDRLWIEGWRASSFAVFAGLFALLAVRPRQLPGVWELVLASKTALVVFAAIIGDVPEARASGIVDFALVAVVASAYVLCRGWQAWRPGSTSPTR